MRRGSGRPSAKPMSAARVASGARRQLSAAHLQPGQDRQLQGAADALEKRLVHANGRWPPGRRHSTSGRPTRAATGPGRPRRRARAGPGRRPAAAVPRPAPRRAAAAPSGPRAPRPAGSRKAATGSARSSADRRQLPPVAREVDEPGRHVVPAPGQGGGDGATGHERDVVLRRGSPQQHAHRLCRQRDGVVGRPGLARAHTSSSPVGAGASGQSPTNSTS